MSDIISTPSNTRAILDKYGLHAKKNYGQNFLVESQIVERIAQHAVLESDCVAVEIGPGIGALTQFLAHHAKEVIAFEIDDRLIPVLADTLQNEKNVKIIHQDFLAVDLDTFFEEDQDIIIAANLPYYITTPILFKIFESHANIKKITVMMQKEVADRFSAKVNTKDYNALSIISQYQYDIKVVMKISKHVFSPKPNVDSSVVQFVPRIRTDQIDEPAFYRMIKACFKQRRKTMLNNYGEFLEDKELAKSYLEKAGILPSARAESLGVDVFMNLFGVQNET